MQNKKSLLWALAASVSIFCIILGLSMFRHLKKMEAEFNGKEAMLREENMDLKGDLDTLQKELMQKIETLTRIEVEGQKLKEEYLEELRMLKKENVSLIEALRGMEKKTLVEHLREALSGEEDGNMKKFLEKVLYNIVLIKSGRSIELEPIVVAKKGEKTPPEQKLVEELSLARKRSLLAEKKGKVLSVDRRYSLVVIDLGRRDDVSENQRCFILKNGEEIASAKIINVRHNVSAAFVDEIRYRQSIRDIKEGDGIVITE